MAELFVKVAKELTRMCNTYEHCYDCPINKVKDKAYACRYWVLLQNPEKAEEVIMKWAKEHSVKTNRDKFREVFGMDIITYQDDWANQEYKEPKKED